MIKNASGFLLTLLCILAVPTLRAQVDYEVRLTTLSRVANTIDLDVEIRSTGASTFVLGTSSFLFNYNIAGLGAPISRPTSLIGPWSNPGNPVADFDYAFLTLNTGSGFAGLTVDFSGGDDDNGTIVPSTFTRVGTVRLTIINAAQTAGLGWRNIGTNTQVFRLTTPGDPGHFQTNITDATNFLPPIDPPLPIQLASFTATILNHNQVRLDWTTLTETNNYGFEIQKSQGNQNNYQTIPNSFIPGHGTTTEPHSYSYTDNTATTGRWYYRLRQIDLDGSAHFTDGILVDMLTGVQERPLPKEFALDQNYPNPFNPSTSIEYAVPRESHVRLELYNLLGQRVATLVDEVKSPGYYTAVFNANDFASGLYFYKMNAGQVSFLKKMMLVK